MKKEVEKPQENDKIREKYYREFCLEELKEKLEVFAKNDYQIFFTSAFESTYCEYSNKYFELHSNENGYIDVLGLNDEEKEQIELFYNKLIEQYEKQRQKQKQEEQITKIVREFFDKITKTEKNIENSSFEQNYLCYSPLRKIANKLKFVKNNLVYYVNVYGDIVRETTEAHKLKNKEDGRYWLDEETGEYIKVGDVD